MRNTRKSSGHSYSVVKVHLFRFRKSVALLFKVSSWNGTGFGERIKRIRNFRKLTQAQLGEAVGLSDVRIRQYEIGNRTPKEDMIQALAKALDCNYRSIYEPSLYAAEDVMYALFELDEHYNMPLYEVANPEDPTERHIAVGFDYFLLDDFLNTWKKKKEDLASGKITKEEYFEWKINWPHKED